MPLITDWLMFCITTIYVVATIFICRANIKAANATRDQIAESQRQFSENRRLDVMPYLQFETTNQPGVDYKIAMILSEDDIGLNSISSSDILNDNFTKLRTY